MTENKTEVAAEQDGPADQLAADTAELEGLNTANKARLQALSRQGVQIDPASVLSLRIDTLAQMVFGEDSPRLIEYKLSVQRQLAEALRELEGEVRKAQFAAAGQMTPGQMKQMARVNGLLGPDGNPLHG